MSSAREDKKVPAIRFAGFGGEWEEDKILNISPLQRGFDLPKNKIKVGNYPVVMSNGINGYHSEYKAIGPGVVTGRSGTIGNIHFIQPNYWPHNTSLWVTSFKGNEPLYIYYMYLKLDLNRFGTGSGVPTLNRNDVHDQLIKIPKDKKEQTKIGNYFQQLDTLIAQHQQKHDKLQNIKKALLEKCFPKQSEHTPELRFKGFSGAWEEKALGDVANGYDNLRIPVTAKDRISGSTPYYGANGIQDYVDGYTHNGEFILIAEDGANDLSNYPVQYVNGKIWVNNHAHVLQAKENIADNSYLKYSISQTDIEPFLVGGGRAKLNAGTMMKILICTSKDIKEQTKIGKLFQQLDTLINQQQTQLSKLKNIKQACLEKMFV